MNKSRSFFETFDLALGRFIAFILGGAGALVLFIAFEGRGGEGSLISTGIGLGLLLIAAAIVYWRVTFLDIIQLFAGGGSSN